MTRPTQPQGLALVLGFALEEIPRAVQWTLAHAPAWVDPTMLDLGLTEAITNALVHGALGVTSDTRSDDIAAYLSEIERRSLSPPSGVTRGVTVSLDASESQFTIELRWTGTPCPEQSRAPEPLAGLPEAGMGQNIIHAVFDEVRWADDGLSQSLVVHHV